MNQIWLKKRLFLDQVLTLQHIYTHTVWGHYHLAPHWVNNWATKAHKTNTKTTTKCSKRISNHKYLQKRTLMKHKFWVNSWVTLGTKICFQHVVQLLTSIIDSAFLGPTMEKGMPTNCRTPFYTFFLQQPYLHTSKTPKKTKPRNSHIWIHNCPLWFYPKGVPLCPPPFELSVLGLHNSNNNSNKNTTTTTTTTTAT